MAKLKKSMRRSRRRMSPKVVMVCSPMKKYKKRSRSRSKRKSKRKSKRRSRKRSKKDGCGCEGKDSGIKKDGCDYGFEDDE